MNTCTEHDHPTHAAALVCGLERQVLAHLYAHTRPRGEFVSARQIGEALGTNWLVIAGAVQGLISRGHAIRCTTRSADGKVLTDFGFSITDAGRVVLEEVTA
jgi:hypothetical protein